MSKEYIIPEEKRQELNEPRLTYGMPVAEHVHMSFEVPDNYDKESFKLLMMLYANKLLKRQNLKHKRFLSDEDLEKQIKDLPSFQDVNCAVLELSKEDYSRFMRVRKPMKGIEKWL
ncbi:MAG: hypothetical protein KBT34_07020 [Prevotella sp.]|nr:hypothetical protein [Candidatus Prevotella equi]